MASDEEARLNFSVVSESACGLNSDSREELNKIIPISERSYAGVTKKQHTFLFTLRLLASAHLKLAEENVRLTRVRQEMGMDEAARAQEVIISNQVWELRNQINEYIQELGAKDTYYAATCNDLTMIFLYLERRSVKIASGLTKQRVAKLRKYASYRYINLI
ncbi:unnamed protein product [Rhodiola kirilowii]